MLEGLVSLEYCTVADIEALAEVGVGRILCSISDPYSVSFKKDPVSYPWSVPDYSWWQFALIVLIKA